MSAEAIKESVRDADATRGKILQVAFEEILLKGYQGLRVDGVLKKTSLTKGAFYHHFKSKKELGHAVIDEVLKPWIEQRWIVPLLSMKQPIDDLIRMLEDARDEISANELHTGCPLNNLTQEMSPLDETFRTRIADIWQEWHQALAKTLQRGIDNGFVKDSVKPNNVARFLIAAMEGIIGQCKCYMNDNAFYEAGACLQDYLESLRP
ncbi:TetR/AcrR family transcriptional regulator [Kangiella sediminilitoris]|uniref:Transcriptional regulator, TetR family n=1 Tax=Kangiella sediminilitoris TaxID=1144748 RepID=A0A1B3BDZ8_9GAMM|nr:TetR/AcrR family transcriptional regulator [Kangiella sediminilitoris]AOE50955.1 Transcriptional regulator, TetR family [Kangiella sediminilitoris]